jgi:hypothetical protein
MPFLLFSCEYLWANESQARCWAWRGGFPQVQRPSRCQSAWIIDLLQQEVEIRWKRYGWTIDFSRGVLNEV